MHEVGSTGSTAGFVLGCFHSKGNKFSATSRLRGSVSSRRSYINTQGSDYSTDLDKVCYDVQGFKLIFITNLNVENFQNYTNVITSTVQLRFMTAYTTLQQHSQGVALLQTRESPEILN